MAILIKGPRYKMTVKLTKIMLNMKVHKTAEKQYKELTPADIKPKEDLKKR